MQFWQLCWTSFSNDRTFFLPTSKRRKFLPKSFFSEGLIICLYWPCWLVECSCGNHRENSCQNFGKILLGVPKWNWKLYFLWYKKFFLKKNFETRTKQFWNPCRNFFANWSWKFCPKSGKKQSFNFSRENVFPQSSHWDT